MLTLSPQSKPACCAGFHPSTTYTCIHTRTVAWHMLLLLGPKPTLCPFLWAHVECQVKLDFPSLVGFFSSSPVLLGPSQKELSPDTP